MDARSKCVPVKLLYRIVELVSCSFTFDLWCWDVLGDVFWVLVDKLVVFVIWIRDRDSSFLKLYFLGHRKLLNFFHGVMMSLNGSLFNLNSNREMVISTILCIGSFQIVVLSFLELNPFRPRFSVVTFSVVPQAEIVSILLMIRMFNKLGQR